MLWTGRPCRRRQCWLWRKRKRATRPASEPKLRQNRIICNRHLAWDIESDHYLILNPDGRRGQRFQVMRCVSELALRDYIVKNKALFS